MWLLQSHALAFGDPAVKGVIALAIVNLVEDSAVIEVNFLRLLPAPKNRFQAEELQFLKLISVLRANRE